VVPVADDDLGLVAHGEARPGLDGQLGAAVDAEVAQRLDERALGAPGHAFLDGAAVDRDVVVRAVEVGRIGAAEVLRVDEERPAAVAVEVVLLEGPDLGAAGEEHAADVLAEAAAGERQRAVDAKHARALAGAAVLEDGAEEAPLAVGVDAHVGPSLAARRQLDGSGFAAAGLDRSRLRVADAEVGVGCEADLDALVDSEDASLAGRALDADVLGHVVRRADVAPGDLVLDGAAVDAHHRAGRQAVRAVDSVDRGGAERDPPAPRALGAVARGTPHPAVASPADPTPPPRPHR